MSEILMRIELHEEVQAHTAVARALWPWAKEQIRQGHELVLVVREIEDQRSIQQNAFYWSFVLKQVSEQAVINGVGSDVDGWHYWFKKNILGYSITKTRVPGSKRPVIRRELRSTKGLSVAKMSRYLEEVMAKAATDFGVQFADKRWEEWRS